MKRLTYFVAIIGLMAVAGSAFAEQHSADISGTWEGQWQFPYGSGSAELKLQQQGSRVTGTIELGSTRTFGNSPKDLNGSVRGNTFTLSAAGGCTVNAELSFEAGKKYDTLAGTFSCTQSGVSMTLYRKK